MSWISLGQRLQTFLRQQEGTLLDGEAVCSVVKAETFGFKFQLCQQSSVMSQVSDLVYNFHHMDNENYGSTYVIRLS